MAQGGENNVSNIAIIGLSCRFPGSKDSDSYWKTIITGESCLRRLDQNELRNNGVEEKDYNSNSFVNISGSLDGIEYFDAKFFNYSPKDARLLDPQQRLFLETAWSTFESAGYDPFKIKDKVGVYAGSSVNSYFLSQIYSNKIILDSLDPFILTTTEKDHLSTRVSYKLNLKGPSVSVQTACSSSLVAVHLACESLLNHETDYALAGGVTITVPQNKGYKYIDGSVLSREGFCRPFSKDADGTVFSDGVGAVLLKRLDDAIDDRDNIICVIKGSAINNDGSDKIGYSAPSPTGQADVIAEAMAVSHLQPHEVAYIEGHGTGTKIGDSIELEAIDRVFKTSNRKLYIGSTKSSIGHSGAASGIAGLIKAALMIKNKKIPANKEIESIDLDSYKSEININHDEVNWDRELPQNIGVSSFGIGGTNSHVIVGPPKEEQPKLKSLIAHQLFIISAKSPQSLNNIQNDLIEYIKCTTEPIANIAHTLRTGRRRFKYTKIFTAENKEDAICNLEGLSEPLKEFFDVDFKPVLYLKGSASALPNCLEDLYRICDSFSGYIKLCIREFQGKLITLSTENHNELKTLYQLPKNIRVFIIEYSLCRFLLDLGIVPSYLLCKGLGCISAMAATQSIPFDSAVNLLIALEKNTKNNFCITHEKVIENSVIKSMLQDINLHETQYKCVTSSDDKIIDKDELLHQLSIDFCDRDAVNNGDILVRTSENLETSNETANGGIDKSNLIAVPDILNQKLNEMIIEIGKLWVKGVEIEWNLIYNPNQHFKALIPTYSFEKERYWISLESGFKDDIRHINEVIDKKDVSLQLVQESVQSIWSNALDLEKVDLNSDFFDVGGDSISALYIVDECSRLFSIELETKALFDNPSPKTLSDFIYQLKNSHSEANEVDKLMAEIKAIDEDQLGI